LITVKITVRFTITVTRRLPSQRGRRRNPSRVSRNFRRFDVGRRRRAEKRRLSVPAEKKAYK
jgi:hypothetical protein